MRQKRKNVMIRISPVFGNKPLGNRVGRLVLARSILRLANPPAGSTRNLANGKKIERTNVNNNTEQVEKRDG